ncbi:MAG: S8 family serine peptidase [Saprospiraceae bacterium]|nr:S8 family serine peptidase [Saprospiraceae bacterium]
MKTNNNCNLSIRILVWLVTLVMMAGLTAQTNILSNNVDGNLLKLAKELETNVLNRSTINGFNSYVIKENMVLCHITKRNDVSGGTFEEEVRRIPGIQLAQPTFQYGFQNAYIPYNSLINLQSNTSIGSINPIFRPETNAHTQGDAALKTNKIRSDYGFTGKGVRIGVISDGVGPLLHPANGDLGPAADDVPQIVSDITLLDEPGAQLFIQNNDDIGNRAEGIAMIEIIRDIAPDADIVFANAFDITGNYLFQAIDALKNAGCQIIVDDVGQFAIPFFQSNVDEHIPIKNTIDEFTNSGGIYLSAVGNFRDKVIQQVYNPGIENKHLFNSGTNDNQVEIKIPAGKRLIVRLQWSNAWNDVYDDFDLKLLDEAGITIAADVDVDNNGGIPYAGINFTNELMQEKSVFLEIACKNVTIVPIVLKLFILGEGKDWAAEDDKHLFEINGTVICQQMYENVITIGTSKYNNLNTITDYSSTGPVRTYSPVFNATLNKNILELTQILFKPDFTSVDGVEVSGFNGFPVNFIGTSAAAPHFAALLALLKEARPNLSRGEILSLLKQHTEKFGPYIYDKEDGKSIETGYGRVNVLSLFQNLPPQNQSYGSCFDVVYADYNYNCGQQKIDQTVGTQFRYKGRACSAPPTSVVNNNNPTGSGSGGNNGGNGPGGPGGGGGPGISTSVNVPPIISKNEDCKECLDALFIKLTNAIQVNNQNGGN